MASIKHWFLEKYYNLNLVIFLESDLIVDVNGSELISFLSVILSNEDVGFGLLDVILFTGKFNKYTFRWKVHYPSNKNQDL